MSLNHDNIAMAEAGTSNSHNTLAALFRRRPQLGGATSSSSPSSINNGTLLKRRASQRNNHQQSAYKHVELPPMLSSSNSNSKWPSAWQLFSWATTCCFPGFALAFCGGIKGPAPQQAWREKVALCWIITFMSGLVLFFVVFFNKLLCPPNQNQYIAANTAGGVIIRGNMYNAIYANKPYNTLFNFPSNYGGYDVTQQFNQLSIPECNGISHPAASLKWPCETDNPATCLDLNQLSITNPPGGIYGLLPMDHLLDNKTSVIPTTAYEWSDIVKRQLTVYNRTVLNLRPYVTLVKPIPGDPIDELLRLAYNEQDASLLFSRNASYAQILSCASKKYYAGELSQLTFECIFARLIIGLTVALVIGVLFVRIFMAMWFSWFMASQLSRTPDVNKLKAQGEPFFKRKERKSIVNAVELADQPGSPSAAAATTATQSLSVALDNYDLYTVFLVTCYSEGENSLRTTLGSLSATHYNDRKKLLFIVADGIITGKGNEKSTPELILDMINLDPGFGENPKPYSYVAVASGSKQHNMAKVYCGYFMFADRAVPTIVVVKCGTPDEAQGSKPGNRGKRDSQLILMNFFSRVTLNDRMTPLDFDLFRKIHHITGVTPDYFEVVLMVDADTQVKNNSLRLMINCMLNDPMIVGLCGETRIANKTENFTTMIQIFEYYISHFLGKAFESVFGGVTCLPGCFCMYRIKARKGDNWIPLLVNPEITHTYATNDVYTLHQKNLFLLGEDRFLSTMMLRTFPKRKMVFVPNAVCKTMVPDDFWTLMSQRRRWINSTVHNLMELLLVNELCGIFCFSMQFVVFMDLLGTAALPASIAVVYYLIYAAATQSYSDPANWLPTAMLLAVVFLPGLLIIFTNFKLSRIGWMFLYLLALPIWQFILPLYAFWRFDDFSWGATRQIAGNAKDAGHGADAKEDDEFDASTVPFRRWEEYERAWRKSQWRKQQKMANAAAMHQMAAVAGGAIPYGIGPDGRPVSIAFYPVGSLMTPPPPPPSSLDGMSDLSASITSSAAAADNAAPVNHRFSMMSTQSIDDQGSVMTESESNFGGEMMQEEERRSQQQGFTSEVMSAAVTPIPHGPSSSSVVTAEEYKNLYN